MKNANEFLMNELVSSGTLRTPAIIAAFHAIDRADFVRPEHRRFAYSDEPLPIGSEQTISQPTTVAIMLELLAPHTGDRVLDVGSGSGWTTALLAHIVGNTGIVYGTERIPDLVHFGAENLARYRFPHTSIVPAGATLGLPERAPFDRILVSAAADELPQELITQLAPGGTLVLPIKTSVWCIKKQNDGSLEAFEYPGFAFVPLVRQQTA